MLHHRSFKPAKCKTALKLAVSRIKLLKNKREAHVKQLRRELAQLLHSGHDHTARIRVEHVVREEKTMAAYDLVEIYCELIAALLPMIESQKNCPIDLKEAISSVIFASPRCSDIPELMDVRKHIMAKYGKEFVSAAVELRPDCGVNRLLVEKLSAKAPDGPTKIKILTAIAEEHNVKWQPKSFGENDVTSSQDLLAGPNTFEKATYVEPPQVRVPPVHDEKEPSNLRASCQLKEMHDISTNSYEQNASVAARNAGGDPSTTSGRSNQEIRSPGIGSQEMDFRDSYPENRSAFPMDRKNWNMEFKDAASAAQAAAESAELASMAARAAAELSNLEKMTRQYSSGSQSSFGSGLRGEVPQQYAFNADKHLYTGSVNSTFRRSNSGMHNEHINTREQDNLVGAPNEYYRNSNENVLKRYQSASLNSAFGNKNPFANVSRMADIYPHNNSFKQENSDFLHKMSTKKQVSRTEVDFMTELHADMNTENNDHFQDARMNRQPSKASSSQFIIPSDDHNDHFGDARTNRLDSSLIFSSPPGSKSQVDPLANTNAWSPGQIIYEKESSSSSRLHFSVVSETLTKSAVSSGEQDSFPLSFDDSDGPSSDSKEDLVKSKVSGSFGYGNSVLDQSANHGALRTSSRNDKKVGSDRKSWLSPSSVGSDTVEEHYERKIDIQKRQSEAYNKSSSRASNTYFDSDTNDFEDGLPKQNSISLARPVSGFSQRMSAPSKTGTNLSFKDASLSKASVTPGTHVASKPSSEPNRFSSEEIMKSSARVQPSNSLPKTMIPGSEEASKSLNSDGYIPSKEKPGHVHPKLPDYDSLAAHFLSLKKGRQ